MTTNVKDIGRPVPEDGLARSINGVSVVIASYRDPAETLQTLESLAAQTLDPARFEVIVVVNGPHAYDTGPYKQFAHLHPHLQLRVIRTPLAGACHALNLGIEAARMNWLTFVDDDDTVSPGFLEGLLTVAGPGVIPLTTIDDVAGDGTVSKDNRINRQVAPHAGTVVRVEDCPRGISFNASKLIPTDWARHIRYDTHLRSGQDIAFYGALYLVYDFEFAVVPEHLGAVYHRALSDTSQSRRDLTFTFAVDERLDVIESLDRRIARANPRKRPVVNSLLRAQTLFIRRFLDANPERRTDVITAIRQRELRAFPWDLITRDAATYLVTSVCFPPFADPSAITVAKRMIERGQVADVVCSDMGTVRKTDESLMQMVDGLVNHTEVIAPTVSFSDWRSVKRFSLEGWRRLENKLGGDWPYRDMYSRAMWPASHVIAGLIKTKRPGTHWIAEFSDPLSKDVQGGRRVGTIEDDELVESLMSAARHTTGVDLPEPESVFELAELLAFSLSDRLVFTNDTQFDYMLSYLPGDLADAARRKATVSPHPILPPEFYHLSESDDPPHNGTVRLAYFGSFYANRSLTDVLTALTRLDYDERSRLELDVYTPNGDNLRRSIAEMSLFDVVSIQPTVDYLSFLNLTTKYDCLVVEDARTVGTHDRNPYLPSKWSDYRGSGTPVWALVESGSTLSALNPEYLSRLGSVDESVEILRDLLQAQPDRNASHLASASEVRTQ